MKIPSPGLYRKSQITWPVSATPDYAGQIGLILHDGALPYWMPSSGASADLPDAMLDDVDRLYKVARKDKHAPCFETSYKNGIAVYGHLVDGHFFGRFLLDIDVAQGKKSTKLDLAMCRAALFRSMVAAKLMRENYAGHLWLAPSVPVMNDAKYGRWYSRWQGEVSQPTDHWMGAEPPAVLMQGALLTDTLVPWQIKVPLSVRPDPLEENEDMLL